MSIVITSVKFKPYKKANFSKLKGFVDIVIDDELVIKGIKLIDTGKKRYIDFPTYRIKTKDGVRDKNQQLVHPINHRFREYLTTKAFYHYDEYLKYSVKK